jgi:hypothetical protein
LGFIEFSQPCGLHFFDNLALIFEMGNLITSKSEHPRLSTKLLTNGGYFYQLLPTAHLHPPRYNLPSIHQLKIQHDFNPARGFHQQHT